MLIFQIS